MANKYEWQYLFTWKNKNNNAKYFHISTSKGLEYAENQAYNTLLFEGGKRHSLKLLAKKKGLRTNAYSNTLIKT